MSLPVEVGFNQVLEDCISGKLLKAQALELLENKYKTAYVDIKQKFGKDRQSFCCYTKYDFEKWIEICDGAERNKPLPERKYNDDIIQRVIEKYAADCKKNDLESGDCVGEIYNEVHQIQNWCRENQETNELYEKYKVEIEALPEAIHQKATGQLPLTQNKYITEMIEEGILSKDGKTPIKSLNDVAIFLADKGQKVTTRLLLDLKLQKDNGELYTRRACEYATNLANTDENQNYKELPSDALIVRKRKKST